MTLRPDSLETLAIMVWHNFISLIIIGQVFVVDKTIAHRGIDVVNTPSGFLKGVLLKTWTNKDFFAFRGIPYAEPPIGNLRFKAPVSVKPWQGVKDATVDGKICNQPNSDFVGPADEDCLFLNVYTKELNSSKPVIVFFHPGAFYSMTGASYWTGPDYLLDQDIVLVTVNYRLDALGFLTTGDRAASGNNGFKDQVMSLKWIQKHITSFGGDPSKVTITGYSAGSTSGFLHMLSPMSKGLFQNVIAMSAGVTSKWVITKDPLKYTKKLATLLNCTTESTDEMIRCLRKVPAKEINGKFQEMRELGGAPMVVFGPVIEPDLRNGEERFLTDDPVTLIKRRQFYEVPVVTGITEYEFIGWSIYVLNNETLRNNLLNNFDTLAPTLFGYDDKPKKEINHITDTFKKFYFGNKPITKNSIYELGRWYSDYTIIYGAHETAKLFAKYSSKPVYFYKLSYKGRFGHDIRDDVTKITNQTIGPVHHDDLIYLFYISRIFPRLNESDPEAFMVKYETSFWKNFATIGNPTPDDAPVQWEPMSVHNKRYLDIDTRLTMKDGLPFPERMQIWERLLPVDTE